MAYWTLQCPLCQKTFRHSEIIKPAIASMLGWFDTKPQFPEGGLSLPCPHCTKVSTFQRHQLVYES
jgi:hypothetical protein